MKRGGTTLRRAVEERAITFVLGAGVSKPRGVPDWRELTRLLWTNLLGARTVPLWLRDNSKALAATRAWLAQSASPELAPRVCLDTPHPLADQMAIELLRARAGNDAKFVAALRSALYATATRRPDPNDTLGVLGQVLVAEQATERRRVLRVITFNADDHLETEGNRGHNGRRDPVLWPIARESGHPRMSRGAHGKAPIPVYHVHGFLPRDGAVQRWRDAPDTLVFTDAEYWATVASSLTFANRVMAQALHDSSCIFIGTSMYDVNLIRWLGVRYNAICNDVATQRGTSRAATRGRAHDALLRHFWIRNEGSDPHQLISELLLARGVRSVPLEAWGAPFQKLLFDSFGVKAAKRRASR
jgi:SIR2-like domain